MRQFFIGITMLIWIQPVFAQKVHSFLFCKTSDRLIGSAAKINYFNMQEEMQNIAETLGYEYISHIATGKNFNATIVANEIQKVEIGEKDIVLLYFSTHGGISKRDTLIFPQLDIPNKLVSAYKNHQLLLGKKPAFLITVVEACSGYQNITPQEAFLYHQSINTLSVENFISFEKLNIQKLFTHQGAIIITAGNPGQDTWATADGSMFTNCFLRALNEYIEMPVQQKDSVSWDNVLDRAKQYTWNMTQTTSSSYFPVWEKKETNEIFPQSIVDTSQVVDYGLIFNVKTKLTWRLKNRLDVNLTVTGNNNKYTIDKVVYYLHNTFIPPIIERKNAEEDFFWSLAVRGTFPLLAKVYLSNGKVVDLYKNFKFGNN